jgi:hypothetical protein
MTLTLKAEADAGTNLRDQMLPEALDLARRMGVRIEISGNDTLFWIHPWDSIADLQSAYDRLYPESSIVSVKMQAPAPRIPISGGG